MIEITATLLVSKRQLRAVGVDTDTDADLTAEVRSFLRKALPFTPSEDDDLSVGVVRKVKRAS